MCVCMCVCVRECVCACVSAFVRVCMPAYVYVRFVYVKDANQILVTNLYVPVPICSLPYFFPFLYVPVPICPPSLYVPGIDLSLCVPTRFSMCL